MRMTDAHDRVCIAGWLIAIGLAVAIGWIAATLSTARGADFYPACLKRDGDWLHGVTADACRELGGIWYSGRRAKHR